MAEIEVKRKAILAALRATSGLDIANLAAALKDFLMIITFTLLSRLALLFKFSKVTTLTLCPALTSAFISVTTKVSDGIWKLGTTIPICFMLNTPKDSNGYFARTVPS
jgi:hypothetical protein